MTRDRRDWEGPQRGDERGRRGGEPSYGFGRPGEREAQPWQGDPYATTSQVRPGGWNHDERHRGDRPHEGAYHGAEGYRGDFDRQRYGREQGGEGGGRDWGAVARERAGFLSERDDVEGLRGGEPEPSGARSPSARMAGDYQRFGGQDHPTWGRGWGMEEQSGWRGPGEMPGYRPATRPRATFAQGTTGGQVPAERNPSWGEDASSGDPDRSRTSGRHRFGPGGPQTEGGRAAGPHAGRGPRNYKRSDERIHDELCDRLTADPHVDASDVEVTVKDRCVVLSGAVPDRRMKHRAEDLAEAVLGVVEVQNELRVRRGGGQQDDRPAKAATTGPSGHDTVLHADAPVLLGAPTARGGADDTESSEGGGRAGSRRARGRGSDRDDASRGGGRGRGRDEGDNH